MLGMMNCTVDDGVEFYAAKKSTASMDSSNSTNTTTSSNHLQVPSEQDLRVFVEYKEKPKITYMRGERGSDGNKSKDGHLKNWFINIKIEKIEFLSRNYFFKKIGKISSFEKI